MTLTERAENARKTLFGRYDQLNALWLRAEEELTRLHIPRSVEFCYQTYTNEDGSYDEEYLGVQKNKGTWKICHGCSDGSPVEVCSGWTPITDCSAETRVRAAKYLPQFREAVVNSAETFIPKVDEAISQLRSALNVPDE